MKKRYNGRNSEAEVVEIVTPEREPQVEETPVVVEEVPEEPKEPEVSVNMSSTKAIVEVAVELTDNDEIRNLVNMVNKAARIAENTAQGIVKKVRHSRVMSVATKPSLNRDKSVIAVEISFEKPLAEEYIKIATEE